MDSLVGITWQKWWRLLRANSFKIQYSYLIKALVVSFLSLKNTRQSKKEQKLFSEKIKNTKIESDPIFILGHWRSGTTFLHNLLSLDRQFAFPNLFEIRNPHSFLQKEALFQKRLQRYHAQKRMMDNMQVALDDPAEEEFAMAMMTLQSPLIGWMFPARSIHYERYSTFSEVAENEIKAWQEQYFYFIKKLTFKYNKQLLLKSPVNTGRIHLILNIFPEAKFIHIHRHPYAVFQSTKKLYETAVQAAKFQFFDRSAIDQFIIERYVDMYQAFFRDLPQIPAENYIEICFEELEKNPKHTLITIYEKLLQISFETVEKNWDHYLQGQANYQKNKYIVLAESVRQQIKEKWKFCFAKWGYEL